MEVPLKHYPPSLPPRGKWQSELFFVKKKKSFKKVTFFYNGKPSTPIPTFCSFHKKRWHAILLSAKFYCKANE